MVYGPIPLARDRPNRSGGAARQHLTPAFQERGALMAVYVAEIGGKGIFAFGAEDDLAAERFVEERWQQSDLRVLEGEDGTQITVREAQDAERKQWREGRAEAVAERDADGSDPDDLFYFMLLPD